MIEFGLAVVCVSLLSKEKKKEKMKISNMIKEYESVRSIDSIAHTNMDEES